MRFLHRDAEYFLPDEWWVEAGMTGFRPQQRLFRSGASPWPDLAVFEVAITDVQPLLRNGSHGVFTDNPETGSAQHRVVRILRGFRERAAIPPIEVARLPDGSSVRFKLIHGAHRFYCSVAAGFSHLPAVEVYDVWGSR
jgi:hypothetical protein